MGTDKSVNRLKSKIQVLLKIRDAAAQAGDLLRESRNEATFSPVGETHSISELEILLNRLCVLLDAEAVLLSRILPRNKL